MKIGITGASGQLGKLAVTELIKKLGTESIVALVRSPEKVKDLGIEARHFDYNEPNELAEQLIGIETLLLISANEIGKRVKQHKNVIDSAKKAGVKWLVYTSILHADKTTINLAGEHLETEKMLKSSGIDYTILRNGWYTENYTASMDSYLAGGAVLGSAGEGKISSASRLDYARAIAVVLSDQNHKGKVYELAGDDAFSLQDLAAEISKQSGKEIPYKNIPETEYAKILESFNIPADFAAAIASWDVSVSKGDLFNNERQLSKLTGRETTPMKETVKASL